MFVMSPDPALELRAGLVADDFDPVMHTANADAPFHPAFRQFQPAAVFLDEFVSAAADAASAASQSAASVR